MSILPRDQNNVSATGVLSSEEVATFDTTEIVNGRLTVTTRVAPDVDRTFVTGGILTVVEGVGATGVPSIGAVTWASDASDTTPDFSFNLPPGTIAGDVLKAEISADGAGIWTEYFSYTLTSQDIIDDAITVNGVDPLADGAYDFRFRIERGAEVGAWSSTVDVTILTVDYRIAASGDRRISATGDSRRAL